MRRIIYIAVIAAAIITSCATSAKAEVEPTLSIELEGNPTTGYIWDYTAEGSGEIEIAEERIEKTSELLGAPSIFYYSFRGVKEGNVTLIFEYARPWEDGEKLYTEIYRLKVNQDLTIEKL